MLLVLGPILVMVALLALAKRRAERSAEEQPDDAT